MTLRACFCWMLILGMTGWPLPVLMARERSVLDLPPVGRLLELSPPKTPPLLAGITVHPDNILRLDFIINPGNGLSKEPGQQTQEFDKLIKYFLASLTIADKDQWVNLSPYEQDRIIEPYFGRTAMGQDLLAQDYLLKQLSSSLTYPESELGRLFWQKVHQISGSRRANAATANSFNKVWIVPDQAVVRQQGNSAYIVRSHLKVMMDFDYLAGKKQSPNRPPAAGYDAEQNAAAVMKEVIVPALEDEVNFGANFAPLRQMVSAMVLATWYKRAMKESLLGRVYTDRAKINGINVHFKRNERIYEQYLKAWKKGVFNYVRNDVDIDGSTVPRKYFSGGISKFSPDALEIRTNGNLPEKATTSSAMLVEVAFQPAMAANAAMTPIEDLKGREPGFLVLPDGTLVLDSKRTRTRLDQLSDYHDDTEGLKRLMARVFHSSDEDYKVLVRNSLKVSSIGGRERTEFHLPVLQRARLSQLRAMQFKDEVIAVGSNLLLPKDFFDLVDSLRRITDPRQLVIVKDLASDYWQGSPITQAEWLLGKHLKLVNQDGTINKPMADTANLFLEYLYSVSGDPIEGKRTTSNEVRFFDRPYARVSQAEIQRILDKFDSMEITRSDVATEEPEQNSVGGIDLDSQHMVLQLEGSGEGRPSFPAVDTAPWKALTGFVPVIVNVKTLAQGADVRR